MKTGMGRPGRLRASAYPRLALSSHRSPPPGSSLPDSPFPTQTSELSHLARALERTMRETSGSLGRLMVPSLHAGPLCSFPQGPAEAAGDVRASILARSGSAPGGLFVLSFDPEVALALLARQGAPPDSPGEAIARLRRLGSKWMAGFASALRQAPPEEEPIVSEDTLVGAVLSAHPPPDTRVLSCELRWPESGTDAVLLWLAQEKAIGSAVEGARADGPQPD